MERSWTCPSCGRRFLHANQWHSCGNAELDERLPGESALAVAIYREIEAALGDAAGFRVHPQRSRVAFISAMTFASVVPRRRWVDLSLILPRPIDDDRIRTLELYGPTSFAHTVRLQDPADVDDDVRAWLAEALRRGDRDTLDPSAEVEPLVGRPLELVTIPLRSTVVAADIGGEGFSVPVYACQALDAHRDVMARIGGERLAGGLVEQPSGRCVLVLDTLTPAELGFGLGDGADVHLRAAL